MQDFRRLSIYKKSIEYCAKIYQYSTKLPVDERYGLIAQIKKAVCSVSLNISEGADCSSNKEFALFITYSYRSVNEVLTCLELIQKLNFEKNIPEIKVLEKEGIELSRMVFVFFRTLGGKTYNL